MKKFVAIALVIFTLCSFVGCGAVSSMENIPENKFDNSGFVVIKQIGNIGIDEVYLVYNVETKVEYILIDGYQEISMCPYYDENGNIVIYKGE